ncbi:MAG: hypothetical protein IPP22_04450 [Nitrosomonas sp.]|nr:hypothetical protein [Nitrosomonas sp.]
MFNNSRFKGSAWQQSTIGYPCSQCQRTAGGITDFEKGKSYFTQIEDAYTAIGFTPSSLKRASKLKS